MSAAGRLIALAWLFSQGINIYVVWVLDLPIR
jgi:hypothetical protein